MESGTTANKEYFGAGITLRPVKVKMKFD